MFNIKNIGKKLLIYGASLMMISNLAIGTVNAKQIHHYNTKITKVKKHAKNNKSLKINKSLNYLLRAMNKDYYTYSHLTINTFKQKLPIMNKCQYKINNNLHHYWNIYTSQQMKKIANNPDAKVSMYNSIDNIADAIHNKEFYYTNHVNKLSQQDNQFDTEIRNALVNDINQTRVSYKRRPLIVTNVMQQVANYRAPKVQYACDHLSDYMKYPHNTSNPGDNWIHGVDTHTTSYEYLRNHGYYSHSLGANAGDWGRKFTINGDGTPDKYSDDTPEHIAGNIDDELINHDNCEGNNNGHRKIELSSEYKYLGVGITYNPQTQQGSFNEQFAN